MLNQNFFSKIEKERKFDVENESKHKIIAKEIRNKLGK
jgi:hypothetical protein